MPTRRPKNAREDERAAVLARLHRLSHALGIEVGAHVVRRGARSVYSTTHAVVSIEWLEVLLESRR